MFKWLQSHRATETHVLFVSAIVLCLLVISVGIQTGHAAFSFAVAMFGLSMLCEVKVIWNIVRSINTKNPADLSSEVRQDIGDVRDRLFLFYKRMETDLKGIEDMQRKLDRIEHKVDALMKKFNVKLS